MKVVSHLYDAGLIVLLVLGSGAKTDDAFASDEHYQTWSAISGGTKPEEIYTRIFQLTTAGLTIDKDNWII